MRSRATRELAERALVRLACAIGDHAKSICVIGGLNADLLTTDVDVPHQGTNDIDVLLEVGLVYDRNELDFGWLERGLHSAGFTPDPSGRPWVWFVSIDALPVRLDLLCDAPDSPGQELALPGARTVAAMNIAGPAPALEGPVRRSMAVHAAEAPFVGRVEGDEVTVRFASLGGYLHAKAAAVHHRREPRDFYDFAYVLLHNSLGGPAEAVAAAVAETPAHAHSDHRQILRAALVALAAEDGARRYAAQRRLDGDPTDEAVLLQDAVGAALAALSELDAVPPRSSPS